MCWGEARKQHNLNNGFLVLRGNLGCYRWCSAPTWTCYWLPWKDLYKDGTCHMGALSTSVHFSIHWARDFEREYVQCALLWYESRVWSQNLWQCWLCLSQWCLGVSGRASRLIWLKSYECAIEHVWDIPSLLHVAQRTVWNLNFPYIYPTKLCCLLEESNFFSCTCGGNIWL